MSAQTIRTDPVAGGGVTEPAGFKAAGVRCGIKKAGLDVALLVADAPASVAAMFTTSRAQAAPVVVSRDHLRGSAGVARAVVVNSGCANACTGEAGLAAAREMAGETARLVGCGPDQVQVASTGVIGVSLDVAKVTRGIRLAHEALSAGGGHDAARAIMTTDLVPKESAYRVPTPRGTFSVGGMAKGSGMIEPMMATMLAYVTTDANVPPTLLQRALREAVDETFNAITVDGECSTNDTVVAMASGASGITIDEAAYPALVEGLRAVSRDLAVAIVRDGEGATKLIEVTTRGAASLRDARVAAKAIANSPLVKTAIHGGDPNWGRLVAVAGRAGVAFDLSRCVVKIGPVELFRDGRPFDERSSTAAEYLKGRDIAIDVDLGAGGADHATVWTCDLSAEYVRINAEYRT